MLRFHGVGVSVLGHREFQSRHMQLKAFSKKSAVTPTTSAVSKIEKGSWIFERVREYWGAGTRKKPLSNKQIHVQL